jgi:hypothetical protein
MSFTVDALKDQIPYYLTKPQKEALAAGLSEFEKTLTITPFSIAKYAKNILQGDSWSGFEIFLFADGSRRNIRGLILSNSCDLDRQNKRDLATNITFVPLIRLSRYCENLTSHGIAEARIQQSIKDIKAQKITSLFYVPKTDGIEEESIAILSDAHTMPLDAFESAPKRKKLLTLSQVAFYLFIFKLSVHFCRMHENVER